jgi:protein TonB
VVCTGVIDVAVSTLPLRRGSHDGALRWRSAISLAASLALHALLLFLFMRPLPPPAPTGRTDVVTVYLRDSRKLPPPSAPEPQIVRAPSRRVAGGPDIAQTRRASGRTPITPAHTSAWTANEAPASGKPARTTERVTATLSRHIDATRSKPSPLDVQANRSFDSNVPYMRELAERLSQVKHYPQLALALHEEGTVLVAFQIDRDGRLLAWKIAASSGHDDLDSEVGRMIAAAAPFPPFPPSWNQSEKMFEVPIGFSLHR